MAAWFSHEGRLGTSCLVSRTPTDILQTRQRITRGTRNRQHVRFSRRWRQRHAVYRAAANCTKRAGLPVRTNGTRLTTLIF